MIIIRHLCRIISWRIVYLSMKKYPTQIKRFGKHIKKLREANNLTQIELGEKAELTSRTIQRIESGEFASTLHILIALGKALNLAPGDLLNDAINK